MVLADTVAATKYAVEMAARAAVSNYIGTSAAEFSSLAKQALEAQIRQILPATVVVTIVEEDEDIQLVRYIHEEPADFIQVEIRMTLDKPLKYLMLEFSPELPNERLGVKFVPCAGS